MLLALMEQFLVVGAEVGMLCTLAVAAEVGMMCTLIRMERMGNKQQMLELKLQPSMLRMPGYWVREMKSKLRHDDFFVEQAG